MNSIFIHYLLFFKNSNFSSNFPYHLITYSKFKYLFQAYFSLLLILQLSLTVSLFIFPNLLQLQLAHYSNPPAPLFYYLTLLFPNSTINLFYLFMHFSQSFTSIHLYSYYPPINCTFVPIPHTFYTQSNSYFIITYNRFVSFDIKIIFCLFKHLIQRCCSLKCHFIVLM